MRSATIATLIAVTGCADSGARTFAATLSDALEMSCRATTRHVAFEQEVIDELAEDLAEDYASAMLEAPPPPLGRILHLLERENEVQAWFDVAGSAEPVAFANAGTVYRGEPQDGYVEARFAVTRNTDEADEDAGLELCGDRLLVEGVLSLTDDDGVQGRIRWLERHHVQAVPSRCLAWIDCARDILVDGLPLD